MAALTTDQCGVNGTAAGRDRAVADYEACAEGNAPQGPDCPAVAYAGFIKYINPTTGKLAKPGYSAYWRRYCDEYLDTWASLVRERGEAGDCPTARDVPNIFDPDGVGDVPDVVTERDAERAERSNARQSQPGSVSIAADALGDVVLDTGEQLSDGIDRDFRS